ncbi:hypothetical protein [Arcicella rigui]|uniref:Uncharacterized protein n=1 Tax=Arcicella rigui TaxID=797020 RepID=A0ABU5Q782_9BACT|nr:hypothetical protein [Arcicella rigui]MEA5138447.1 hypothetical protein [Arcicella rigui]
MIKDIENSLYLISDIWNDIILKYKLKDCKIDFTPEVESNFISDIIRYFLDTLIIVYNENKKVNDSFSENVENSISFLQIIFVQQDFIEEIMKVLKCPETSSMKKDDNRLINRDLRNELIGHPVSWNTRLKIFESSTIFGNTVNRNQIVYIKYSKNDNFKGEIITIKRSDILERHHNYLLKYLDIIIENLIICLEKYKEKIKKIEETISKEESFKNKLLFLSEEFKYIFHHNYLYSPDLLLDIYSLKHTHQRYDNVISKFEQYLNDVISEIKNDLDYTISNLNQENRIKRSDEIEEYIEEHGYPTASSENNDSLMVHSRYVYLLENLADRKQIEKFNFFSSLLIEEANNDKLVNEEISNMRNNIDSDLEYYSSYNLLRTLLGC